MGGNAGVAGAGAGVSCSVGAGDSALAVDFGELKRNGFLVAGRIATAVRSRRRSASALSVSEVRSAAAVALCCAGETGFGTPFGDTATHVASRPPPPNHNAFNVVRVITMASSYPNLSRGAHPRRSVTSSPNHLCYYSSCVPQVAQKASAIVPKNIYILSLSSPPATRPPVFRGRRSRISADGR